MTEIERLDFQVGSQLQAYGGILDNLDYARLRRLGVLLRLIPKPGESWDIPPSSLVGWIESYGATIECIQIAQRSGVLPLLRDCSDEIRRLLSFETIPALDAHLIGEKEVEELIAHAQQEDHFKEFDFERFMSSAPTNEDIARVIVVNLNYPGPYQAEPKVEKHVGLRRLQVGALIGKAATGGALAVGNLALGVLGGLSVLPAVSPTEIPIAAGIVTSVYTGLAAAFDAVEKIGATLRA
jgi:hypothetical protein